MALKAIAPYRNIYTAEAGTRLVYGTDMEGNLSALVAFVFNTQKTGPGLQINLKCLEDLEEADLAALELDIEPNCHFIFGGDATDHGGYDITVLRLLVTLKKRYPKQVTLIAGNRDVNKIRWKQEINPAFVETMFHLPLDASGQTPEPHWLPEEKRVALKDYIQSGLPESILEAVGQIEDWEKLSTQSKELLYLHWALTKTLNSPKGFEMRRVELKCRGKKHGPFDVLESFKGEDIFWHEQYLQQANLGVVINNVTIVHGGLTPQTFIVTLLNAKTEGREHPYNSYLPQALLLMDYKDWMLADEPFRQQAVEKLLAHLSTLDRKTCRAIRNTVFEELDADFQIHLAQEWQALDPSIDRDSIQGTLLAQGTVNRWALPTDSGLVCYNNVNKDGDLRLDLRWETFLRQAGACENISGHIPQGDRGRMLSGRVRHVLLDTTFKKQLDGIPNEDVLDIRFDSAGGHTLRMCNSQEEHLYPAMDCEGHFSDELMVKGSTLIQLDTDFLPEKYQGNPCIENRPWCIGPRIEGKGEPHYLLSQKHGPAGKFKTHVLEVSEKAFKKLQEKKQ